MRKTTFCTRSFSLLLAVLAVSLQAYSQQQKPSADPGTENQDDVIRVTTTLVTVTVSARDHHGKVVTNLRREDFRLLEDGSEQEIVYFDAPKEIGTAPDTPSLPFTVALLLDVSDSAEFKLQQIQQAAIAFIDQLQADDRVLVIDFDKRVRVLAEATTDRSVLREAIRRTQTGGGTSLYSAVDIALTNRLKNISGRKAIVLFTDGVDTASVGATLDSTVRAAVQSDAVIYPVQYNTYNDFADSPSRESAVGVFGSAGHATKNGELASDAYKRGAQYLRLLAATTGGHVEYSDSLKNLSQAFARIALHLRQQYTLGYYPKNKATNGVARQIKVQVAKPEVVVSARKSYVYAPR